MQLLTLASLLTVLAATGSASSSNSVVQGKHKVKVESTQVLRYGPIVRLKGDSKGRLTMKVRGEEEFRKYRDNRSAFEKWIIEPFRKLFGTRHPHPYSKHRHYLSKKGQIKKARKMLTKLQKTPMGPKFCKQLNETNKILLRIDHNTTGLMNPACVNYYHVKKSVLVHPARKYRKRRRGFLGRMFRAKTYYRYDQRDYGRPDNRYKKKEAKTKHRSHHGHKHKVKVTSKRKHRYNYKSPGAVVSTRDSHPDNRYKKEEVKIKHRSHHGRKHKVKVTSKGRHRYDYNSPDIVVPTRDGRPYGTGAYSIRSRHDGSYVGGTTKKRPSRCDCSKRKTKSKVKRKHKTKTKKSKASKKCKVSKKSKVTKKSKTTKKGKATKKSKASTSRYSQLERHIKDVYKRMLAYVRGESKGSAHKKKYKTKTKSKKYKTKTKSKKYKTKTKSKKYKTKVKHHGKCRKVIPGSPTGNHLIKVLRDKPERCGRHHISSARECHYARIRHGKSKKYRDGKKRSTVKWFKSNKHHKGYCVQVVRRREIVTKRDVLRGKGSKGKKRHHKCMM